MLCPPSSPLATETKFKHEANKNNTFKENFLQQLYWSKKLPLSDVWFRFRRHKRTCDECMQCQVQFVLLSKNYSLEVHWKRLGYNSICTKPRKANCTAEESENMPCRQGTLNFQFRSSFSFQKILMSFVTCSLYCTTFTGKKACAWELSHVCFLCFYDRPPAKLTDMFRTLKELNSKCSFAS